MSARKPKDEDVDFIERNLLILKEQINAAESYLRNNSWTKIDDVEKKAKEFKFQKDLTDSIMSWNESYMNMCGILDLYNQMQIKSNKNNLKAGQSISGIQMYVKGKAESKLK